MITATTMAKFGRITGNKLKIAVEKLQRSFSVGKTKCQYSSFDELEEFSDSIPVPDDVKEGHFAVIAVNTGNEPKKKRFIVPLSYLSHPGFVRLLEKAAEEYGFDHDGALTVPCQPSELERILSEQWKEDTDSSGAVKWPSCDKTMVKVTILIK